MNLEDTILLNLIRRMERLELIVFKLQTDSIVDKTELPQDILEENGLLPDPPKTTKQGSGARPLLLSEIHDAKQKTRNESRAAKYLGVSFKTYKKYCKMYNCWNPSK